VIKKLNRLESKQFVDNTSVYGRTIVNNFSLYIQQWKNLINTHTHTRTEYVGNFVFRPFYSRENIILCCCCCRRRRRYCFTVVVHHFSLIVLVRPPSASRLSSLIPYPHRPPYFSFRIFYSCPSAVRRKRFSRHVPTYHTRTRNSKCRHAPTSDTTFGVTGRKRYFGSCFSPPFTGSAPLRRYKFSGLRRVAVFYEREPTRPPAGNIARYRTVAVHFPSIRAISDVRLSRFSRQSNHYNAPPYPPNDFV